VPCYFSPLKDSQSAGCNALKQSWANYSFPYCNPPWNLIPSALAKAKSEGKTVLFVAPVWKAQPWWEELMNRRVDSITFTNPVYLDAVGDVRPKPVWDTIIAVIRP